MQVKREGEGGGLLPEPYNPGTEEEGSLEEKDVEECALIACPILSTRDWYDCFLLHNARPVWFPLH